MIKRSGIGWTDFSGGDLNFVIGCTPESEGCAHCYARVLIEGRQGRDFAKIRLYPDKLRRLAQARFEPKGEPFRRGPGSRPLAFVVDLGDLFHGGVPDEFVLEALQVMAGRPDVDWQILTKRALSALSFQAVYGGDIWGHAWLGFTGENQRRFDERAAAFEHVQATVRFASVEPMLGPVRLGRAAEWLDWVIVGAESGNRRRPFELDWARSLRDECIEAGIPFFFKQGSHRWPGRLDRLDGREWKQYPN